MHQHQFINHFRFWQLAVALIVMSLVGSITVAQAETTPEPATEHYSEAELDRLLAPIALYPDSLLSHILIASTYPLEVIAAERWVRENDRLSPQQALERAAGETWDPSVKALVGTPDVLQHMSDDLQWMQSIGEAFLAQQEDVLERIQVLRADAYAAGSLRSNENIDVVQEVVPRVVPQVVANTRQDTTPEVVEEKRVIVIETVKTETVYVPYYNPWVVYGSWRWHSYPPVYWTRPTLTVSVGSGIYWGISYTFPAQYYFSHFYWPQRYVVINRHYYRNPVKHRRDYYMTGVNSSRWYHNPRHRRGVDYRHRDLQPQQPKYYMVTGGDRQSAAATHPRVSQRAVTHEALATSLRGAAVSLEPATRDPKVTASPRAVGNTPAIPSPRAGVSQPTVPQSRPNVQITPRNTPPKWGDAVMREQPVARPPASSRQPTVTPPVSTTPRWESTTPRAIQTTPGDVSTTPRATQNTPRMVTPSTPSMGTPRPAATQTPRHTPRSMPTPTPRYESTQPVRQSSRSRD